MINTARIQILPTNIHSFVTEIGATLRNLYGPSAETAYLDTAKASYSRLIRHPDIRVWTCGQTETRGLLVCLVRRGIAHITLFHVLKSEISKGIEDALLNTATAELRAEGVRGIIGEFVRYRPLAVERPLTSLGFTRFDRQMMIADVGNPNLALNVPSSTSPCGDRDTLAAGVLVDAYEGHPSRSLHPEAQDETGAISFLETFRAGGFGATMPSLYRIYGTNDDCRGMIAAAEAAPDVGFILHVASRRSAQGTGIGSQLVREVAAIFRSGGYSRIALGVTCGNPAERLYARLGFDHLMPVETYAWWAA